MGAADNFFSKAEQALKKRNYDYAIELYQQGLMIDPDRVDERKKLRATAVRRCQDNGSDTTGGRMFKMKHMGLIGKVKKLGVQKKYEEQIVELEKVLALAPQQTSVLMDLGHAFEATNRFESAIQSFREAVDLDRQNTEGWKALGRLYGDNKDVEQAVKCWETVRALRPEDNEAGKAIRDLSAAAMMAKADERRGSGDGSFRDLLKDEDESSKLEKKQAIIRTTGDANSAIDFKKQDIAEDPDNPRLIRELGDLHLKMNQFDEARAAYERAIELNPQDPYAKDKLGTLQERSHEFDLEQAKLAVSANPDDPAAQEAVASAEKALHVFMLVEYARRVAAHPTDYGLKYKFGCLLFEEDRFDEAIGQFQNAVKDPKFQVGSRFMIGRSFHAKKLFDLAIKEYGNALSHIAEADSDLGKDVRYRLGEAHLAKGAKDKALECFEEIMSVDISYQDVSTRVDQIRTME